MGSCFLLRYWLIYVHPISNTLDCFLIITLDHYIIMFTCRIFLFLLQFLIPVLIFVINALEFFHVQLLQFNLNVLQFVNIAPKSFFLIGCFQVFPTISIKFSWHARKLKILKGHSPPLEVFFSSNNKGLWYDIPRSKYFTITSSNSDISF